MAEEKNQEQNGADSVAASDGTAAGEASMAENANEQAAAVAELDELVATAELVEEAAADAPGDASELERQVEQLQTDLEQARDATLRATADAQNIKRRAEQDVEKARKYALERFCGELLPVVDNLERALETVSGAEESLQPIAEGVELTLKSFLDALRKFNIEPVDPHGEPFDPQLHQAMSMVENTDVEPNSVLTVMQKGYTLNGRLVRPAMVMVSKAPAA